MDKSLRNLALMAAVAGALTLPAERSSYEPPRSPTPRRSRLGKAKRKQAKRDKRKNRS